MSSWGNSRYTRIWWYNSRCKVYLKRKGTLKDEDIIRITVGSWNITSTLKAILELLLQILWKHYFPPKEYYRKIISSASSSVHLFKLQRWNDRLETSPYTLQIHWCIHHCLLRLSIEISDSPNNSISQLRLSIFSFWKQFTCT